MPEPTSRPRKCGNPPEGRAPNHEGAPCGGVRPALLRLRVQHATLALLPLLGGCAAAFGKGPQMVSVSSSPPGATIHYRDYDVGVTPATIAMSWPDREITLRMAGYHERTCDIGTDSNFGWVLVGILLWGPFEILADAAARAWARIDDRPVHVELAHASAGRLPLWERPKPLVEGQPNFRLLDSHR